MGTRLPGGGGIRPMHGLEKPTLALAWPSGCGGEAVLPGVETGSLRGRFWGPHRWRP